MSFVRREKIKDIDVMTPIEEIMELGPTTFRFDTNLERAAEFMDAHQVDCVLLTSPEENSSACCIVSLR